MTVDVARDRVFAVRCERPKGLRQPLGFSLYYFVLILCIGWFLFAMRDPNYKWIFVDDNVVRVRNGLAILVLIYGILMGRRFQRLVSGRLAAARISIDGDKVIVTKDSMTPFVRPRVETVTMPVEVRLEEHRSVSLFGGMHMRTIRLSGSGSVSRVNSFAVWEDERGDALRAFLAR